MDAEENTAADEEGPTPRTEDGDSAEVPSISSPGNCGADSGCSKAGRKASESAPIADAGVDASISSGHLEDASGTHTIQVEPHDAVDVTSQAGNDAPVATSAPHDSLDVMHLCDATSKSIPVMTSEIHCATDMTSGSCDVTPVLSSQTSGEVSLTSLSSTAPMRDSHDAASDLPDVSAVTKNSSCATETTAIMPSLDSKPTPAVPANCLSNQQSDAHLGDNRDKLHNCMKSISASAALPNSSANVQGPGMVHLSKTTTVPPLVGEITDNATSETVLGGDACHGLVSGASAKLDTGRETMSLAATKSGALFAGSERAAAVESVEKTKSLTMDNDLGKSGCGEMTAAHGGGRETAGIAEACPVACDAEKDSAGDGLCNLTIENVTSLRGASDFEHFDVPVADSESASRERDVQPSSPANSSTNGRDTGQNCSLKSDLHPTQNSLSSILTGKPGVEIPPQSRATSTSSNCTVSGKQNQTQALPKAVKVSGVSHEVSGAGPANTAVEPRRRKRKPEVTTRNALSRDIDISHVKREKVDDDVIITRVKNSSSSALGHLASIVREVPVKKGLRGQGDRAPASTWLLPASTAGSMPSQVVYNIVPEHKKAGPSNAGRLISMTSLPHTLSSVSGSGEHAAQSTPTSKVYGFMPEASTWVVSPSAAQMGKPGPAVLPVQKATVSTASKTPGSNALRQLVANSHSFALSSTQSSQVTAQGLSKRTPMRAPAAQVEYPVHGNMSYMFEQTLKTGQKAFILKTKDGPLAALRGAVPLQQKKDSVLKSQLQSKPAPLKTTLEPPPPLKPLPDLLVGEPLSAHQLKCREVLGTNHLPVYRAAMPPSHLEMDASDVKVMTCQACGDSFTSESSLEDHMLRRSVLINYSCPAQSCLRTYEFYNKCAFLAHEKQHTREKRGMWNTDDFSLEPLPEHLMDLQDSARTNVAVAVTDLEEQSKAAKHARTVESKQDGGDTPGATSQTSPQMIPAPLKAITVHNTPRPSEVHQLSIQCSECQMCFRTRKSLTQHFVQGIKQTLSCQKCLMVLPHLCAYLAHSRIHSMEPPYVCPDCGLQHKGPRELFMKHVKKVCLHFMRQYQVTCPLCGGKYHLLGQLQGHIESMHKETYYKCLAKGCFTAFRSSQAFEVHKVKLHGGSAAHELIYKCPMCDTVYQSYPALKTHISLHTKELEKKASYVFKCPECSKVYAKKLYARQHMMAAHPEAGVLSAICELCDKEFVRHKDFIDHQLVDCTGEQEAKAREESQPEQLAERNQVNAAGEPKPDRKKDESNEVDELFIPTATSSIKTWECNRCQVIFGDEEVYQRHVSKHLFLERRRKNCEQRRLEVSLKKIKLEQVVDKAGKMEDEAVDFTGEVKRQVPAPEKEANFRCTECKERFMEELQLDEHLKTDHGIQPQYPCHLCGLTYSNELDLGRHLDTAHGTGRAIQARFTCWWCSKANKPRSYSKRSQLEHHLIRFHSRTLARTGLNIADYLKEGQKSQEEAEKNSADEGSIPPAQDAGVRKLKVSGDTLFACAKCSFSSKTREDFSKHIFKHKTQADSVQCLECGLCFTVKPTLRMHLMMVHKIRDFARYAKESGMDVNSLPAQDTTPLVKPILNGLTPRRRVRTPRLQARPSGDGDDRAADQKLECQVCYKTFDDEVALHKHLRTHGMAFIKSTSRRQNAEFF